MLNDDEEHIYNEILRKLKPGTKWGPKEDEIYREQAAQSWWR